MAVQVAVDLKLFEIISKPTTLGEIVEQTSADPVILMRILRAVSSVGFLNQTTKTTWAPTALTHVVAIPAFRDWMSTTFDQRVKSSGSFPEWLAKREYKTTGAVDDCVASEVLGMSIWEYYDTNPEASAIFDSSMSIQNAAPPEMQPPYPFRSQLSSQIRTDPDAVTLVDIGGGYGHAIQQIEAEYPHLKGRFVLQDLPKTIDKIDPAHAAKAGYEPMAHDFFKPQPVKGAKYYHLRRVLHD